MKHIQLQCALGGWRPGLRSSVRLGRGRALHTYEVLIPLSSCLMAEDRRRGEGGSGVAGTSPPPPPLGLPPVG